MATSRAFRSILGLPEEKLTAKISRRVLAGDKAMLVWLNIKAGAHAAPHAHAHEQLVWVLRGKMEFRIGDARRALGAGELAVIPGGTEHEAWCREDALVVDVFAPPREDFLAGETPAYLRDGS